MARLAVLCIVVVLTGFAVAGCGDSSDAAAPTPTADTATTASAAPTCPPTWYRGWQQLADDIGAPVYCPSWMPEPLDGRMGGPWFNGRSVNDRNAYLVSFAWLEVGLAGETLEVHVNFRGYPGQAKVPVCEDTVTVNGKTVHPKMPCFSDARGKKRVAGKTVTVYTANQGADLWHVLYAWHHRGALYTVSEHVAPPYTYAQVIRNLDRIVRSLERLTPTT